MKKILFLLVVFVYQNTSAQIKPGMQAGFNNAWMREVMNDKMITRHSIIRPNIGFTLEIPFDEKWAMQSGLYYSGKGCRFGKTVSGKIDSITIRLNYIEIPLKVAYKFPEDATNKFFISAGVYMGYGFKGRYEVKGSPHQALENLHNDSMYKRIDFGAVINFGYGINDKYGFRLEYTHGLMNISQWKDSRTKNNTGALIFFIALRQRE
jgi:hypothetical protein